MRKLKISKATNQNELKELDAMKAYCENTVIYRRFWVLKHFDGNEKAKKECSVLTKHDCCDICFPLCICDTCAECLQQQKDRNEHQQAQSKNAFNSRN